MARHPAGREGGRIAKNTPRHRLRTIKICFERLIEWEWPDAPGLCAGSGHELGRVLVVQELGQWVGARRDVAREDRVAQLAGPEPGAASISTTRR